MQIFKDTIIDGPHGKPIIADIYFTADHSPKPVIIFSHGFKGFKDWGHFELAAQAFAEKGFVFIKFNFSHNGVTPDDLLNFSDLETFGNNNLSIELDDLGTVIDFVHGADFPVPGDEVDPSALYLLGHSRGGGITILKAREDARVKKIATWASVNDYGQYWSDELVAQWKKEGVIYAPNARTGQQMPLYWQLYEIFFENRERLDVPAAVKALKIPFLIVHGTADPTVPYRAAVQMRKWNANARLLTIHDGDHTFGGRHPWESTELPGDAQTVVRKTAEFFNER